MSSSSAPTDDVEICLPVNEKKRKGGSAAANDEGGPPKKKQKKRYCKVEGCNKWRIEGGVCVRHGGKVKLCSSEGCTNQAQNGGVCIRHGGKKLCSFEGCTNQVQNGGVCKRHGAKKRICSSKGCKNQVKKGGVCRRHGANLVITPSTKARGGNRGNEYQQIQQQQQQQQQQQHNNCMSSTSRFTSLDHHPYLQQWNDHYDHNHSFINPDWAWGHHPYYGFEGRNMAAMQGEFLRGREESSIAAQANNQGDRIQEGNNQNDVVALIEESDNEDEEEGGKKQSPDAGQKRKPSDGKQKAAAPSSTDTGDDGLEGVNDKITGNKGTCKGSQNGVLKQSSLGKVVNLNDDNEQGKSDTMLQKRAIEVGNLEDDSEQDASDVAVMQGGNGVSGGASDDQNECDYGGDDEDVQSEEGNHPHEGPEETTVNVKEVEKEHERMLTSELGDANTMVVALSEKLIAMSEEMVAVKSRSISEREKNCSLRSQLNKAMSQYKEKSDAAAKLVAELAAKKEENAEMHTELMKATTDQLEKKAAKDAFAAKLEEMTKKFEAEKADLNLRLQASSKESKELNNQVIALKMELEGATRKEADLNTKLAEVTDKSEASRVLSDSMKADLARKEEELQKSAFELKKMAANVDALNAKLHKGVQNKAALNAQMGRMIDDFASERNRLESIQHQQQSTIDDLCDKLKDRKAELKKKDEKITGMKRKEQISEDTLREANTEIAETKASLEEANSRNVSLAKQLEDLQDSKSKLEQEKATSDALLKEANEKSKNAERMLAELRSKEVTMKETFEAEKADLNLQVQASSKEWKELNNQVNGQSAEIIALKRELEGAVQKEAGLSDDLEAMRTSSESIRKQLQSTIESQRALLTKWRNEANEKSKRVDSLTVDLGNKEAAMKEMSTEVAALNAKLAEHAQGSDIAKLERQMGTLREELGMANLKLSKQEEELGKANVKISKQEETSDIAMKKIEELEESTKNLPKRVQPPRRSRSSLETLDFEEPSRSSNCEENGKEMTEKEKMRKEIETMNTNIPDVSLDDIIGQENAKRALSGLKPFRDPAYDCLYADDKDDSISNIGVLLYGPPGTGKTMFAKALATSGDCIFISISTDNILRKYIGQSEERMRAAFLIAKEKAAESGKTAVLFIDECDRLFRKPGKDDCEVSSNITVIFQECMNGIDEPKGQLIVVGATNYIDELPEPIKSRFAYTIEIKLPDTKERIAILESIVKSNHSLTEDDFARFADMTDGDSGRDIFHLITNGAEPARKNEAKDHSGAWCKNEKDCYIPCYHSLDHPCRGKESGTLKEVKKRLKTEHFRPRPLAMKHIEMGIDLIGASNDGEHEEA